jgi:hypothetical protein
MQSPNGASLKGDVIAALAGPRAAGQYASATKQESSAQAIGQVAKLEAMQPSSAMASPSCSMSAMPY